MPRQSNKVNLASLFQAVAGNLANQKETLNNADTYNHDHGDNMVDTFNVISQAMQAKRNATPTDQLAYASQLLRQRQSGSAQLYAQGLSQASKEFQGQKKVTPDNSIKLIQALLGGGQAAAAPAQAGMGDLLGSLLGGGAAPTQGQPADNGLDVGDLLNAGRSYMDTKARGGSTLEALIGALVSNSAMGGTQHRTESGSMVANALLQALGSLTAKR